eukprot:CAMPEP_0202034772 /NCGR_PEP_ID=MMETSP0905-20130828/66732_1 /ASSEMBLY_ACC=CAM_ASM_000554 /TAXON_ID=420261 /ORGANISM="Thalassiosira antarctica, Strain CCMP982" /LENGTH=497 /DNA_ID=CAMNT_0048598715 /DNA_START=100 /DNA_END=1590 /DNA_ORIENTATION=-
MGAKKKGKKKSSRGLSGRLDAVSLSSSAPAPRINDVSPLLFGPMDGETYGKLPFALPFIGPISLVERGTENGNNDDSLVMHGRGLITTRDVSQGECLFVVPSIISADVAEVRRRYLQEEDGGGGGVDLEQITEDNLVEQVQSLCKILDDDKIQPKENVDRARRLLGAFSAQMSSEVVPKIEKPDEWMGILVANESSSYKDKITLDRETILNTIRRNAFGPDYHNYDAIAQCWTKKTNTENSHNRLLGVYPLSAVINHSCSPNAVRVFGRIPSPKSNASSEIDNIQGREVMMVHANANIPKGSELSWSYLPPSTPFATRREMLQSKYGFTCRCTRCIKEEVALNAAEFKVLSALADGCCSLRDANQHNQVMKNLVPSIEKVFASTKKISNESQRYLRVGYASLYMEYFNMRLSLDNDEKIVEVLKLGTQLHFSFVSCNTNSTEHLSILHLCYDLSSLLHNRAIKGSSPDATARTMSQVRFWTEQLKRAHMTRYGELGE